MCMTNIEWRQLVSFTIPSGGFLEGGAGRVGWEGEGREGGGPEGGNREDEGCEWEGLWGAFLETVTMVAVAD